MEMGKSKIKSVSLVISTYNRPDALKVCLESSIRQTVLPTEIIIGDDGSKKETELMINEFKKRSPVVIHHVWHEDNGFRLAMMRNKSMAIAKSEYIIEIDGDIILHPCFIEDHLSEARKGCYVKGGRVNLNRELSEEICKTGKLLPINMLTKGIESKAENSIRLPWLAHLISPFYRRNRSGALGCNMSFWKSDLIRINGYDEFYEGWGGEDGDFGCRLQMSGIKKRYLKFSGIVYHLWHEDKYMYNKDLNFNYSMSCKARGIIRCENGIDKYLKNN